MNLPVRPWSEHDFLTVVCEQALLARNECGLLYRGEWSSEDLRLKAVEGDWVWLPPSVNAFVDVLIDECGDLNGPRRVIFHTAMLRRHELGGVVRKTKNRVPALAPWYVDWAVEAAVLAFVTSPHLREPFEFSRINRYFLYHRFNDNPCFELLRDGSNNR